MPAEQAQARPGSERRAQPFAQVGERLEQELLAVEAAQACTTT